MKARLLALAATLLLPLAALAQLPAPYTATYEVRRNGDVLGTATVDFRALPGGRYELHSHTVGSEGLALRLHRFRCGPQPRKPRIEVRDRPALEAKRMEFARKLPGQLA